MILLAYEMDTVNPNLRQDDEYLARGGNQLGHGGISKLSWR